MPGSHTTTTPASGSTVAGATATTLASTVATATVRAVTKALKTVSSHPPTQAAASAPPQRAHPSTAAPTTVPPLPTTVMSATAAATAATSDPSKSMLLLAFDYAFYVWTFLLIGIVTYLSIYKYYQHLQTQQRMRRAATLRAQQQPYQPRSIFLRLLDFISYVCVLVYQRIIYPMFVNRTGANPQAAANMTVNASPFKQTNSSAGWQGQQQQQQFNSAVTSGSTSSAASSFSRFFSSAFSSAYGAAVGNDSLLCLNSLLKWFYLNMDTANRINSTILNILNFNFSGSGQRPMSIGSKYDDLVFKHVDAMPPKLVDIHTISSDSESLTLKACIEFTNVDFKIELRRNQRALDVKLLNATAHVLMVLNQSKTNHQVFNLDCYFDQNHEVGLNFRRDSNLDQGLYQYLESLIKVSIKHYMMSMEFNFISRKLTSNFRNAGSTAHQTLNNIINQSSVSTSSMMGVPTSMATPSQSSSQSYPNAGARSTGQDQVRLGNNNDQQLNMMQMRNSINEKRLLVKLLKANNLTNTEEPFCVVELDYPMQKHITDVHRDMSNINEQFLFDINASSEELTFSLFDRAKDYGNDLIGEAVLPVNDLCSSMSSKRVIQLHRFGQTKTGSITAEFVFIEPSGSKIELNKANINRTGVNSRNSRSPYDPQMGGGPSNQMQYRDEMGYDQKLNVITSDSLSSSSYLTPVPGSYQPGRGNQQYGKNQQEYSGHSPGSTTDGTNYYSSGTQQQQSPSNVHIMTNDPTTRAALHQQQLQQQGVSSNISMQSPSSAAAAAAAVGSNTRVINRNYLQIQPNSSYGATGPNKSPSGTLTNQQQSASMYAMNSQLDPKRTRSISNSLKSLLMPRSASRAHQAQMYGVKKREKSYDSPSLLLQSSHHPYDTQSVNVDNSRSRTKGLTLRRLFGSKKAALARRYDTTSINQPLRPGSPAVSIAISRPISPTQQLMMQSGQNEQLLKQQQQQQFLQGNMQSAGSNQQQNMSPQSSNYGYQSYPQQQHQLNINNFNLTTQQDLMMSSSVHTKVNDDAYRREPLLLKRGYISP